MDFDVFEGFLKPLKNLGFSKPFSGPVICHHLQHYFGFPYFWVTEYSMRI